MKEKMNIKKIFTKLAFAFICIFSIGVMNVDAETLVTTEAQLRNALSGEDPSITEVKLGENIEITGSNLVIYPVNDLTLDLCGNTINGNVSTNQKSIEIQYGKNSLTSGSLTIKDSGSTAGSIKSYNNISVTNNNSDTSSGKNYSLIIENGQFIVKGGTWSSDVFSLGYSLADRNVTFNFQVKDGYFEKGYNNGGLLSLYDNFTNDNINLNIKFDKLTFYGGSSYGYRLIYSYSDDVTLKLSDVVGSGSKVVLKRTDGGATATLTDLNVSATSSDPLNSLLNLYNTIEVVKTDGFDVSDVTLNETYGFSVGTATAVEIPIKNRGTSALKIKNVTVDDSRFKIVDGTETNLSAGATDTTWKIQANDATLSKGTYTATITVTAETADGDKYYYGNVTLVVGAKTISGIGIDLSSEITYEDTYTPTIVGTTELVAGDYEIKYSKKDGETYTDIDYQPSDVGEYRVTLKVTNENYTASNVSVDFKIVAKTITPTVEDVSEEQYTGEQITPDVIVSYGGTPLEKDIDYTVEYDTNKSIGEGKVTIKAVSGRNYTFADTTKTFNIVARTLTDGDVTLTQTSYRYTGSDIKPVPVVKVGDKTLVAGSNYELSYSDNKNLGNNTARVRVTGKGNYTGIIDIYFSIIEKDPQVISFAETDVTKTYGDSDFTITANHTQGDGTVTYTSTNTDVATVDATTGKVTIIKAGNATIKATASATTDYAEETAEYTLIVEKKVLSYTVTVNNKVFDNNTTATISDITFTGLVGSESLTKDTDYTVSAEFTSVNVGNDVDVNVTITLIDTAITENYTLVGTVTTANITGKEIVESGVTVDTTTPYTYSGSEIKPDVIVKDGTTTLTEGTDYSVVYSNNINVGFGKVKITGMGNYSGEIEKQFRIKSKTITPTIEGIVDVTYNGTQHKPVVVVKDGTTVLENGTDYTVTYGSNTSVGTGTVTIASIGGTNYVFTDVTETFNIVEKTLTDGDVSLSQTSFRYNGSAITPEPVVKDGDKTLVKGTDYELSYSDNITIGDNTAKVTVTGKGNYKGTVNKNFSIVEKTILNITGMSDNQTITYTGSPVVLVGTLQVDNGFNANDLMEIWYTETGTTEISKPTNVGKYKVVYSYEDVDFIGSKTIIVEITKKASIAPSVDLYKGIAGEKLSTITLPNGFKWDDGNQNIGKGNYSYSVSYTTNNDTTNYTTLTATIEVYGKAKVNLTTSVNGDIGGTISSNKSNILEDTTETIIFTPNTGYEISKVEVNGVDKTSSVVDNKLDVVVGINNINVVVTYKVIQYTITINGVANATIDPSGVIKVDYNTNKVFTIKADTGYKLVSVNVNGVERKDDIVNDKLTLENILASAEVVVVVEKNVYEVIEGANQEYTITKNSEAKFRIDADYSKFEDGGKVYVDGVLVDEENYTSKSGSTIITLKQSFVDTLSVGEHTLKVTFNDGGEATANFTIAKVAQELDNPKTGDNIALYITTGIVSVVGLIGASVFVIRRKQEN